MVIMVKKTTDNTQVKQHEAAEAELPEHLKVKTTDKVRTPGWRMFDFVAHWVINWGLNITASIVTAHDMWNYQRNKAIKEGKLEGQERKLLLGPVSEWFHSFTERAEKKWFQPFWDTVMPGRLIKEGENKGQVNKNDKYKYGRQQAVGITGGVFILSFGGHITTLIAQFFETPRIKQRLVRWLDKNVTDPVRRMFGKGPDEHELEERKAIYHKLDNELSGKSAIGMWGSRFAGIGMVILSMITLGAIDKLVVKDNPNLSKDENETLRGFGRAPQAFFAGSRWLKEKTDGKFSPDYLNPPKEGEFIDKSGRNYAQFIARMASLEVVGSTITAITQYLYLMAQEFFGVGPKTNVADKEEKDAAKKGQKAPKATVAEYKVDIAPAPQASREAPQREARSERKTHENTAVETAKNKDEQSARHSEKNKPAGATHRAKARASQDTPMEQAV